jgi:hypothetical protein
MAQARPRADARMKASESKKLQADCTVMATALEVIAQMGSVSLNGRHRKIARAALDAVGGEVVPG